MSTLGERIRMLRKQKDMTQEEMGKALNIAKSTVSQYESNTNVPDIEMLKHIATLFNVSIDTLVDHEIEEIDLLNKKDKRDIEKIIEDTKNQLLENEGLMFDGDPATPEAIQSILDAMRVGLEIAKQRNKEKYTPKKFKKNV